VSVWKTPIVAEFFQPTCPKCQEIADTWEQIAVTTEDVIIASYNCLADETSKLFCEGMHVSQTPTIVFIEEGKDARQGPRFDVLDGDFTVSRFETWL